MIDVAPTKAETTQAAKTLSKKGAALGGIARARKLTKARRREIAQIAARARWRKTA